MDLATSSKSGDVAYLSFASGSAMYRNCIFCSAAFGTNAVLETFPVGHQLAFDSERGRLWAVCPSCARWNLSPIEERWEAVEDAERLFRDARLRVQSENIGLARLPDGTRLVRVGRTVGGELAAWRYGSQLVRRRRRHMVVGSASIAAGVAVIGGLSAMGVGMGGILVGNSIVQKRLRQRVIHRIAPAVRDSDMIDDGSIVGRRNRHGDLVIRHWHLAGMNLECGTDGQLQVVVRDAHRNEPASRGEVDRKSTDIVVVKGDAARALLGRAMVRVNAKGATKKNVADATHLLEQAGSADRILREAGLGGAALGKLAGRDPEVLMGHWALAFEMALNEASERRALEGELAALEAAWREAEEIAGIADALPGVATLNRMFDRLLG